MFLTDLFWRNVCSSLYLDAHWLTQSDCQSSWSTQNATIKLKKHVKSYSSSIDSISGVGKEKRQVKTKHKNLKIS